MGGASRTRLRHEGALNVPFPPPSPSLILPSLTHLIFILYLHSTSLSLSPFPSSPSCLRLTQLPILNPSLSPFFLAFSHHHPPSSSILVFFHLFPSPPLSFLSFRFPFSIERDFQSERWSTNISPTHSLLEVSSEAGTLFRMCGPCVDPFKILRFFSCFPTF